MIGNSVGAHNSKIGEPQRHREKREKREKGLRATRAGVLLCASVPLWSTRRLIRVLPPYVFLRVFVFDLTPGDM
jgi:hypothetical protein